MNHNLTMAVARTRDLAGIIELPTPVADALAHLRLLDDLALPTVDLSIDLAGKITPASLGKTVEKMIDDRLRADARPAVIDELGDHLGRAVLRAHGEWSADIAERLAPVFDAAAAEYLEAIRHLPDDCRDASLVRSGSATVRHFETAQRCGQVMKALAAHRDRLAELGWRNPEPSTWVGFATRFATVTPDAAPRTQFLDTDDPVGKWRSLLAIDGVTDLRWRTLEEQARNLDAIANHTAAKPRPNRGVVVIG